MTEAPSEGMKAMVIDNGSGMCKAGFSGDAQPRTVFSEVVGKPQKTGVLIGIGQKEQYIGEEAQSKRGVLNLSYPIQHGLVKNWDEMQQIWYHTIHNELRVDPTEYATLLTEPPLSPYDYTPSYRENREKMTQIFFETFKIPAFYAANQGMLALYAAGRTTGIVVSSGDGVTSIVPVYDGYSISHAVVKTMLAGCDLTKYLQNLVIGRGWSMITTSAYEIIREIKERLCYVELDFEAAMANSHKSNKYDKSYTFPDGQIMVIDNERFRVPELLFQPALDGMIYEGIHKLTYDSINKCGMDVRKDLFENINLAGGSTMFEGLPERLQKYVQALAPPQIQVNIIAQPERKYSVWLGGSVISSLSSFQNMWITKEEYAEAGVDIVHRKCF